MRRGRHAHTVKSHARVTFFFSFFWLLSTQHSVLMIGKLATLQDLYFLYFLYVICGTIFGIQQIIFVEFAWLVMSVS